MRGIGNSATAIDHGTSIQLQLQKNPGHLRRHGEIYNID